MRLAFTACLWALFAALSITPSPAYVQAADGRVGTKIILKHAKVQLRVEYRTVEAGPGFRVFAVQQTKAGWLWVTSGTLEGWVQESDVVPYDQAIDYYTASIKNSPSATAYVNRGLVRAEQRDYENAVADFSDALRIDPNHATALSNRAFAWTMKRDYDRALADYSEMIRLDAKNAASFSNRGAVCATKGDDEKALADFGEAIRLDHNFAAAYKWRASLWRKHHQYENAIAEYTELLRIDPKNAVAYADRGFAWRAKRDFPKAIEDYSQALRLDPTFTSAYVERGTVWQARRDFDKALADYSMAVRVNPKQTQAYLPRASLWWLRKEYDKALADYTTLIQLSPDRPDGYNARAWLMSTCADPRFRNGKQAVAEATRASELSSWSDWRCMDTLAASYAEAGDFDNALKWQEKTIEMMPKSDAALVEVARKQLLSYRDKEPFREAPKAQ